MTLPFEDLSPNRPTLTQVIRAAIEGALAELHTGLPARVLAYDATSQSVDVFPLLKRSVLVDDDGPSVISTPVITRVPVVYPAFGPWSITAPLVAGDIVYLAFAERSLETWKAATAGDEVDPNDTRKHSLSDAIAIPGLRPRTSPLPVGAGLRIGNTDGSVMIELTEAGARIVSPTLALDVGGTADQPNVRGTELQTFFTALLAWLASHGHGGPGTPPTLPPPTLPASLLSTTILGR